ncbi:aromatic ring-hydroxylating oxygenase subunit alpha [Zavarzinia sp. CC-PAN008]|uniref:aromatic ring-hydroxylating oxygenase subunit alpha n=1 Tax=Zavarzinia sp. CC-PAN008 TaxID=3243332 RepID=UPI003F742B2D
MAATSDLFDPEHYSAVRKPLKEACALPREAYTEPAFYARELERVFRPSWNFVARLDELPNPGDYLVFDLAGESVIVVHGSDGAPRAFVNSCRHRGTRLLEGAGRCGKLISCPYHAWAFDTEGHLIATPGMEDVACFDKAEWGLVPVRLETWAGFIFITLSAATPPLAEFLGNAPEVFAPYNFGDMVCVRRKDYVLDCNWKIYIENAMEDYHTPTVHRKSIGLQETLLEQSSENWDAIYMESDRTIAILAEDTTPFPSIPTLDARTAKRSYFATIYPGMFFVATQDCMWWLQVIPLAHDRMKVSHGACFPRGITERPDFAHAVAPYYRRWDKSIPEDNDISLAQQLGLNSRLARPGRLSLHEPVVHIMANWILDRVLDQSPGVSAAA